MSTRCQKAIQVPALACGTLYNTLHIYLVNWLADFVSGFYFKKDIIYLDLKDSKQQEQRLRLPGL